MSGCHAHACRGRADFARKQPDAHGKRGHGTRHPVFAAPSTVPRARPPSCDDSSTSRSSTRPPIWGRFRNSCGHTTRKSWARPVGAKREQIVQALWTDIQTSLDALHLDYRKARIYQDGLPICGFEERIVRELANAGSSNHQLILRLLDEGATLMGTEDPRLLMEEYEMQKRHLARPADRASAPQARPQKGHPDRVLQARDAFVVKRIADTLQEGEVGLLFLGALHRLGFAPVHRSPAGNAGRPLRDHITRSCTAATVPAPRSGLRATRGRIPPFGSERRPHALARPGTSAGS